jgi:serine/threonine-protein kinase
VRAWLDVRPIARAEELLARGESETARAEVRSALKRRPDDARLHVLLGRALHQGGQLSAGIEAFEDAHRADPGALARDAAALRALSTDLARERRVADRAARLLASVGAPAGPALAAASGDGPGSARLRALDLLREVARPPRSDLGRAYAALLDDLDCDVRRGAARRLADLGDPAALPKLKALAEATTETKGFLGIPKTVPGCGAAEAAAAMKQIAEGGNRRARAD